MGEEGRKQFTFYESFGRAIQRLKSLEDQAIAYNVIFDYAIDGKQPDMDTIPDSVAMLFELIKPNLDSSKRKAIAGKQGGNKQKANESKSKANESKSKANESKSKANESKSKANESKSKANESKSKANRKQGETASEKEKEKEKEIEIENECYISPLPPLEGGADFSDELQEAFSSWLAYKKERKETYKPTGLQALVTQVQNAAKEYGDNAVSALIRESMANGWKGIIFDRLKQGRGPYQQKSSGNPFMEMLKEGVFDE